MKQGRMRFVVELDRHELAFRILSALGGLQLPAGVTAQEAMRSIEDEPAAQLFLKAAAAAAEYFQERLNYKQRVQ